MNLLQVTTTIFLLVIFSQSVFCSDDYSKSKRDLPRYDFSFDRVSNNFCGRGDTGGCDWWEYGQSFIIMFAFGVILSVICLILFIIMIFFKICSCCISSSTTIYSKEKIRHYRYSVIIASVFMLVALICGFVGNSQINSGIDQFFENIIETEEDLLTQAESIQEDLLKFEDVITINIGSTVDGVKELKQASLDTKDTVDGYENPRKIYTIVIFIVICGTFFLATLLALRFRKGKTASFLATFLLFTGVIMWAGFSTHFALSILLNDVCYEISSDNFDSDDGAVQQGFLDSIMDCTGSSIFNDFTTAIEEARADVGTTMCEGITSFCNKKAELTNNTSECADDPSECNSTNTNNWREEKLPNRVSGCYDLSEIYQTQTCHEPSTYDCTQLGATFVYTDSECLESLTVEECSEICNDEEQKDGAAAFTDGLDDFDDFNDMLDKILDAVNCESITKTWTDGKSIICTTIGNGLTLVSFGCAFAGSVIIIGSFIFVIGEKKFSVDPDDLEKEEALETSSSSSSTSSSSYSDFEKDHVKMSDFGTMKMKKNKLNSNQGIDNPDLLEQQIIQEDLEKNKEIEDPNLLEQRIIQEDLKQNKMNMNMATNPNNSSMHMSMNMNSNPNINSIVSMASNMNTIQNVDNKTVNGLN
ncbi:tweety-related [Anaeramoeba flamelloides]|uniref:Tweety-related n=1 Tax=Anaeramoeba flamelloides TaxID=1746091 RepID=A0ABQ8X1G3_9EUKA|nr:tweety-related [Anaeramoeba flamelloides]